MPAAKGPPPRDPKYQTGTSTPHPIRVNDQLWEDFKTAASLDGWYPTEALRWLMEQYVGGPRKGSRRG
jgi:hypothetical protein